MIPLTRLNGSGFGLNPDAIVRADVTPDTVLTLADGSKYVVTESLDEVIDRVVAFRAAVQRRALDPLAAAIDASRAAAADEAAQDPVDGDPDVIRLRPRRG